LKWLFCAIAVAAIVCAVWPESTAQYNRRTVVRVRKYTDAGQKVLSIRVIFANAQTDSYFDVGDDLHLDEVIVATKSGSQRYYQPGGSPPNRLLLPHQKITSQMNENYERLRAIIDQYVELDGIPWRPATTEPRGNPETVIYPDQEIQHAVPLGRLRGARTR
jgi:hypothetical protein